MKAIASIFPMLLIGACISRKDATDSSEDTDISTDSAVLDSGSLDTAVDDTGTEELIDNDGDGFSVEEDCDDNNASIYPGAEEFCDDLDSDCDGTLNDPGTVSQAVVDPAGIESWSNLDPGSLVGFSTVGVGEIHFCDGLFPARITTEHTTTFIGHGDATLSGEGQHQIIFINKPIEVGIDGLSFTDGYSVFGGSIECTSLQNNPDNATLFMSNSSVLNSAAINGGGIGLKRCDATIQNSIFNGNSATHTGEPNEGYGAAINARASTVTSNGNTYRGSTGFSAAVFLRDSQGSDFTDDVFTSNSMQQTAALLLGLGTQDSAAQATATNTSFKNNSSDHPAYGAISVKVDSDFYGTNVEFFNNVPSDVKTEQQNHIYNSTVTIDCDMNGCQER